MYGCVYVIKYPVETSKGLANENLDLQEVITYRVLRPQLHLVCYYCLRSGDPMIIQNRDCIGGSLEITGSEKMSVNHSRNFTDTHLQICLGLNNRYNSEVVHVDFQPGNIFMT